MGTDFIPCSAMFTEHHQPTGEGEDAQERQQVVVLLEEERIPSRGGVCSGGCDNSVPRAWESFRWLAGVGVGQQQGPGDGLRLSRRVPRRTWWPLRSINV